jgi:hypothetical protein
MMMYSRGDTLLAQDVPFSTIPCCARHGQAGVRSNRDGTPFRLGGYAFVSSAPPDFNPMPFRDFELNPRPVHNSLRNLAGNFGAEFDPEQGIRIPEQGI